MRHRHAPLVATLLVTLAACHSAHPRTGTEILAAAETRDAWLDVLLPVAIAALLLLVLVIKRHRRNPNSALGGLFRSRRIPDLRALYRDRAAAVERGAATRREREAIAATVAAEAQRAFERRQAAAAEARKKLLERLPLPDLQQLLRIETDTDVVVGRIITGDDAHLELEPGPFGMARKIEWSEIRRINRSPDRGRRWEVPVAFAIVGAGLLGACGWMLDALDTSTSGRQHPLNPLMGWGILVGGSLAGGLGMLIMYALPGRRWQRVVDVKPGAPPLTLATLSQRASDIAADDLDATPESQEVVENIARLLLAIVVFGGCALLSR